MTFEDNNSSNESLTCTYCGRNFNTVEDLNDHQKSEQQDQVERNKGFIDG